MYEINLESSILANLFFGNNCIVHFFWESQKTCPIIKDRSQIVSVTEGGGWLENANNN